MGKPYYQDSHITIYCGDSKVVLPELLSDSVDLLATDPPYGISFMGKEWDKALPDIKIWQECLRVLKPGAFAFVMCIPRADCLSRMIISLEDAGFMVNFTPIFWAMASGFPKAENIAKAIDKQECRKQLAEKLGRKPTKEEFDEAWKEFREVVGQAITGNAKQKTNASGEFANGSEVNQGTQLVDITKSATPQAKALDGSYAGFQPKPAVEVIIVAMKPLSEKTYVDQALKNGKGISWLDDCRIPYEDGGPSGVYGTSNATCTPTFNASLGQHDFKSTPHNAGRFPANLLVSDDVLNDGKQWHGGHNETQAMSIFGNNMRDRIQVKRDCDSGSFSRYFDLDKWAQKTFPFLIVPKASKSEKNRGCEDLAPRKVSRMNTYNGNEELGEAWHPIDDRLGKPRDRFVAEMKNYHPTVKPVKLVSYLITLGSREGDVVVDPFVGSGTTGVACALLGRRFIGIDTEEKYCELTVNRNRQGVLSEWK